MFEKITIYPTGRVVGIAYICTILVDTAKSTTMHIIFQSVKFDQYILIYTYAVCNAHTACIWIAIESMLLNLFARNFAFKCYSAENVSMCST